MATEFEILKILHEKDFTQIDNLAIDDKRISPGAKGLLIFLLSRSPRWKPSHEHLQESLNVSWRQIQKLVNELKSVGYLKIVKNREGGRFQSTTWVVTERPEAHRNTNAGDTVEQSEQNDRITNAGDTAKFKSTENQDAVNGDIKEVNIIKYKYLYNHLLENYPIQNSKLFSKLQSNIYKTEIGQTYRNLSRLEKNKSFVLEEMLTRAIKTVFQNIGEYLFRLTKMRYQEIDAGELVEFAMGYGVLGDLIANEDDAVENVTLLTALAIFEFVNTNGSAMGVERKGPQRPLKHRGLEQTQTSV